MIDKETNRVWFIVLVVTVFCIFGLWQCGCGGNSARTTQTDRMEKIEKRQEETVQKVEGNANAITTMKVEVENNTQISKKNAQTIQGGMGFNAEEVGEVNSEVDNTKNSTLLMVVLFGMNLLVFGSIIIVLIKAKRRG